MEEAIVGGQPCNRISVDETTYKTRYVKVCGYAVVRTEDQGKESINHYNASQQNPNLIQTLFVE